MHSDKSSFRHESLQDNTTITALLKAVTDGLEKGTITFSDDDGEIVMSPQGLLNLKVTASQDEGRNRFTLRVTWQDEASHKASKKSLSVK